jgi:hypothetical protein
MALTKIKSTGTDLSANTVTIGTLYRGNLPIVCNDVSTQFDGRKAVFPLKQDQTSINTVVDSKDVQVTLNGQILAPYVKELTYPWIVEYNSYKGFRVTSNGNLIIYNAPAPGDQAVVMITGTSQSVQTCKYPFSATTIALGD